MAELIRFRVAEGISAWSAGDYDLTFDAGPVHSVSTGKAGLARAVKDAIDAGALVACTKADEDEWLKVVERREAAKAGDEG